MKPKYLITFLFVLLIILIASNAASAKSKSYSKNGLFFPITGSTKTMKIRNDAKGGGNFGDSRGNRLHEGVDIGISKGQTIYSPIDGRITRTFNAYSGDYFYKGIEIVGTGNYEGKTVKLMYMTTTKEGQTVRAGDKIGKAQSIKAKYGSGMDDHIHFEVLEYGEKIDPTFLIFNISI